MGNDLFPISHPPEYPFEISGWKAHQNDYSIRVSTDFDSLWNQGIVGCTPGPQRTLMGNLSKKHYIVGIYGLESPRIPREHNKYDGYAVRGTPKCVLQGIESDLLSS